MPELILVVILSLISVVSAFFAVISKKTLTAIIASGVVSLMASIIFLLVAAPDVAMTEAAIGSGLTTVVFLYALKHLKEGRRKDND
jgi:energy-converting hydrogenase B subunit D